MRLFHLSTMNFEYVLDAVIDAVGISLALSSSTQRFCFCDVLLINTIRDL